MSTVAGDKSSTSAVGVSVICLPGRNRRVGMGREMGRGSGRNQVMRHEQSPASTKVGRNVYEGTPQTVGFLQNLKIFKLNELSLITRFKVLKFGCVNIHSLVNKILCARHWIGKYDLRVVAVCDLASSFSVLVLCFY